MIDRGRQRRYWTTALVALVASTLSGSAIRAEDDDDKDNRPVTIGVIGDMPYTSQHALDPWTHAVGTPAQQQEEFDSRLAADLQWLERVFELAEQSHAREVVLGIQADMWDPAAGAAELTGYDQIIQELARLVLDFGRPVLLLNGDSHDFKVDNPVAAGVSTPVPNLTRITVQGGSGQFPLEYLRVTVDPRSRRTPSSWERVVPTLAP